MKAAKLRNNLKYRLIGNKLMKSMVINTLLLFPDKISESISKKCWFVSSFEDGWAFVVKGEEIKRGEYLIFLSDELLQEPKKQIVYTIAHEIGHVMLGHKNSIGEVQKKREVTMQEKEAHEFVLKYLNFLQRD